MTGTGADPLPAGALYGRDGLTPARSARAVPVAKARAWAEAGQRPPPNQLLVVRLHTKKPKHLTVELSVMFGAQAVATQTAEPDELPSKDDPVAHVRFLCVYGVGATDLSFDGVKVIDVSEASAHAPQVAVKALKKKRQELPLSGDQAGWSTEGYWSAARRYRQEQGGAEESAAA
jgi:hypothetical protein